MIRYHSYAQLENDLSAVQQQTGTTSDQNIKQAIAAITAQKQQQQQQLTVEAQAMLEKRQLLYTHLVQGLSTMEAAATMYIDKLNEWRQLQRLRSEPQARLSGALDQIQVWADALVNLVWRFRQLAKQLAALQAKLPINPEGEQSFDAPYHKAHAMLARLIHRYVKHAERLFCCCCATS